MKEGNIIYMIVDEENKIISIENLMSKENGKKYNYLIYCNNMIISLLKRADNKKWCSINYKIKEKDYNKWKSKKYDLSYFRVHGYSKEINTIYYRHILFSLLADYVEYVSNSIICATKKQINSSYTLLRKPLKDDLLLLEMLYVKGHNFVGKFLNNSIDNFSIDRISSDKKKKIIREACKKCNIKKTNVLFYNFRYNKKKDYSLERLWNPASHIITTCKDYKTEDGNLNMIFNDVKNIEKLINHYFNIMPSVQHYVLKMFLSILYNEGLITEFEYIVNTSISSIKSAAVVTEINDNNIDNFIFVCPHCNNTFEFKDDINIKNKCLFNLNMTCSNCKKTIHLDKFLEYSIKDN